ncbi:sigma factor-like helix-turn-helix DNA-binding protein [Amycolatopsis sp.]|uniref:sigma factor-like helix-turn-helix DNA-binding protein n=1 Tax=Amycolatopsis sp. TaxID=37632 RepID=UPI002E0418F4|nr:sigma factor-like helix-turn-helix DNA-binding protein [Amycolatopsis sp.]
MGPDTAFAGLSEGDRDVLVLVARDGLDLEEVALALDIPPGIASSRLSRARKRVHSSEGLAEILRWHEVVPPEDHPAIVATEREPAVRHRRLRSALVVVVALVATSSAVPPATVEPTTTPQAATSVPRPDQLLYTKSRLADGTVTESWSSVDGTRDVFRRGDGCKDGKQVILNANNPELIGRFTRCAPAPAYDPALPTTADGMVTDLAGQYDGTLNNVNGIGKDVRFLLGGRYLRPDQRAALVEAVTKIPGLGVENGVKDLAGRQGLGIFWDSPDGGRTEFVVDSETYQYLGTATEAALAYEIVDAGPSVR